jgi:N-methylhydantoinase B
VFGERAQAGSGSIWPFTLRGDEAPYGRFVVDMLPHGGRGATTELDGMIPVAFPHNSVVTPVEIMETKAPVLFLRKELRAGSAGGGRRRGGLGQTIAFRHVGREDIVLSIIPDKIATAPPGLAGGEPGERGIVRLNGDVLERFPAIRFRPGDELELVLPGGAGFGDPDEREAERILEDERMGYVPAVERVG